MSLVGDVSKDQKNSGGRSAVTWDNGRLSHVSFLSTASQGASLFGFFLDNFGICFDKTSSTHHNYNMVAGPFHAPRIKTEMKGFTASNAPKVERFSCMSS